MLGCVVAYGTPEPLLLVLIDLTLIGRSMFSVHQGAKIANST